MQSSSTQNASERFVSCIHISLLNFAFYQAHKQNPKGVAFLSFKELYLGSHSELDTGLCKPFFLAMIDTANLKNIDLSFWIM